MAYSDFTISKLKAAYNLNIRTVSRLFGDVPSIQAGEWLLRMLETSVGLAQTIGTEKARSEFIIAPILMESRSQAIQKGFDVSLFSGTEFTVDEAQGLKGFCDYLLTRSANGFLIESPVIAVVEAKNENIAAALPQCISEMIAARMFNEQENNRIPIIYGIVTTGSAWRFLKLDGALVQIDDHDYAANELEKLLGVLVSILCSQENG
jgi:hypothetical protein